ncbi:NAD(P)-binding domain-containing protein [Nocardia sp. CDC159]|uniref:NAD(P)-binding domain-containing protein n=1 Tax=Nocardia pulmonis TaxID=2951408 RepID=A0A9X2EG28_9NOCA|nr:MULTISPECIES: NAD(P)-binding domain-containing protein [Nocardia]MCM6778875.1 NAD(P)-binding domain-containing protein [Nocardia pulmonis]MCM6791764.1 NAD(P)-binding domain-containing protein [Nocardia sp. CDC159]
MNTPVTVLGTGSMGSALATAFLAARHPTTVWNRDPRRAAPLAAAGANQRLDIADAVAANSLIIACLTTFAATRESLAAAETELRGHALITLNSGSPSEAREFAHWATERGARFLGGAIKNVPSAVGRPDTLLYFGGERAVFDEYADTLRVLGGDLVYLGAEPDLAALYESAVGATLLPTLLGFFEGAAVLAARGLPARTMVPYSIKWLQMIESLLPIIAEEIDTRDYTRLGSSVALFETAIGADERLGRESGIDVSWHAPMHDLLRRAVAEGRGSRASPHWSNCSPHRPAPTSPEYHWLSDASPLQPNWISLSRDSPYLLR